MGGGMGGGDLGRGFGHAIGGEDGPAEVGGGGCERGRESAAADEDGAERGRGAAACGGEVVELGGDEGGERGGGVGDEGGEVVGVPACGHGDDRGFGQEGTGVDAHAADVEGGERAEPEIVRGGEEPCIDGCGVGQEGVAGEADDGWSRGGGTGGGEGEVAVRDGVEGRCWVERGARVCEEEAGSVRVGEVGGWRLGWMEGWRGERGGSFETLPWEVGEEMVEAEAGAGWREEVGAVREDGFEEGVGFEEVVGEETGLELGVRPAGGFCGGP